MSYLWQFISLLMDRHLNQGFSADMWFVFYMRICLQDLIFLQSQGHSPSTSKDQTRSGGSGPFNGLSSYSGNPTSSIIENMKVRPKWDTFSSSIITESPTECSKQDKYSPPMSPSSTFTANSVTIDPHCYPPSSPPFPYNYPPSSFNQVQIDVEQTIIRDDGEIIADLNLHGCGGSDKGSGEDDDSDTDREKRRSLDVSRST